MPKAKSTTWELLVEGCELDAEAKKRQKRYEEIAVANNQVEDYLSKNWIEKKAGKTKTILVKDKPIGDAYEDQIWSFLYKMGFKIMNASNDFHLSYSPDKEDLTKQIDVIAMDEETCLFIECKAASKEGSKQSWQKEIAEMAYLFPKLCAEIRKKYPNRKCKYIFATNNYVLGEQDKKRLDEEKIYHFDNNTVLYYEKLVSYLGSAAKYQLLGSLFAGQIISNMDNCIPAIKGFMGGITYYSFLIKPSDLLKIGYVLHRTNANNDYEELLPSYQRLIKKDRLKKVREFVDNGGYFPNSLIISVDTKKGKPMQFDLIGKVGGGDSLMQMGMLHLPQTYQSAYIIDGQHRLYGYSDSEYADKNSIPVVAFDNLSNDIQLKLFMEINENQKAVSKALRNILEIDIYFESEDPVLRKKALLGKIAKRLGEDHQSPLNGRVIIGEDAQTAKCCITIDYIKAALDKTTFFNKYKKNGTIIEKGIFDKVDNEITMKTFYPLLLNYLSKIQELCPEEWESYIAKNNAIVAVIRIFDDIVSIVLEKNSELIGNYEKLLYECDNYILELASTLSELPPEKREAIRNLRGERAKEDAYRTVQMAMHENCSDFTNEGIEKYYVEKYTNYASISVEQAERLKAYLLQITKQNFDGENWKVKHMSEDHHTEFDLRIHKKEISNQHQGINNSIDEWNELNFMDFYKIIYYSTHWKDVYKDAFLQIGFEKTKVDFLMQLKSISEIYEKAKNGKSVTLSEYNQINELSEQLMEEI